MFSFAFYYAKNKKYITRKKHTLLEIIFLLEMFVLFRLLFSCSFDYIFLGLQIRVLMIRLNK